jgi:hypothetical protein
MKGAKIGVLVLGALLIAAAGEIMGAAAPEKPALPLVLPEVVPDQDPPADRPVQLAEGARGRHPRLLFSAEDIPALKRLAQGEGKVFFEQLEAYLPACQPFEETEFLTNDTDGLRQGMWRIPTVALHYVLTGEEQSRERTIGFLRKLLALDHWQLGEEQDSGMGAANLLAGAALAYDWLYHDLDPALRESFRQKLLLMARRMYYGGHLQKNPGAHYWQQDPQNNHRWHRDAGLALAVLGIAGDGPGDEWLLQKTFEELRFLHEWLPEDGTCHESPGYMVFGGPYLVLAMQASDRCFGTSYLDHPFFRYSPLFRMHTLTPGFRDAFPFGDAGGLGYFNNYLFKCTAQHRQSDLQAGLWRLFQADRDAFDYGWFSLIWYDPSVTGGSVDRLPTTALYPDLGVAFMRDGWRSDGVGAMFKCGPYGGRRLNQYRNANEFHYVNVAHDDPDANMFVIAVGGDLLADDDRYSTHKMTRAHNTILVNGKGQKGEGSEWTQPLEGADMAGLATLTTWKDANEVVVAEGEAGRMYEGLSRYRRAFIWVNGSYLLVLDDIRAAQEAEITWLVQGPQVEAADEAERSYRLSKGEAECGLRVLADHTFSASIADSPADNHGRPLGYRQLQLKASAARWRVAALFDPWNHRSLELHAEYPDQESAFLSITGPGFRDVWQWKAAPDETTPATFLGKRAGGFSVTVGAKDKAPREGPPVTR